MYISPSEFESFPFQIKSDRTINNLFFLVVMRQQVEMWTPFESPIIAVCGLSSYLGRSENCWTKLKKTKIIFQISILNPHGFNERFHSTNLFVLSRYNDPAYSVTPFPAYKHTQPTIVLQKLSRWPINLSTPLRKSNHLSESSVYLI